MLACLVGWTVISVTELRTQKEEWLYGAKMNLIEFKCRLIPDHRPCLGSSFLA